jgi:hypothetical protein
VSNRQGGKAAFTKAAVTLALVLVALAAVYVGISVWKGAAQSRLEAAQVETQRLADQKKQYAEVIRVKEELKMTEDALIASMSYEINWPELIDGLFAKTPQGSELQSITLRGMSAAEAMPPPRNILAPAPVGSIDIVLMAPSVAGVAEWIESIKTIPGVEDVDWASVRSEAPSDSGAGADDADEDGETYRVNASGQVNLIGLSGNEYLTPEFLAWLATAKMGAQPEPTNQGGAG